MSEIRQRKGEQPATEGSAPSADAKVDRAKVAARLTTMLESLKSKPKPGLTNESKQFKDALAADPFNIDLIFELGRAYGADQQWDKCANVLLRGFKRVSEFKNPDDRFEMLVILCQASMHEKKYRQALTVLNEISEPPDALESLADFDSLKCQVYCFNGDMVKGLKAFNKAIEGQEFDLAISTWAGCSAALRRAGAWAVTKTTLEGLAKTDADKDKLDAVENLAKLKDAYLQEDRPKTDVARYAAVALVVVAMLVFVYLLWLLEARSLESWKMRK
ncbi:unnamed protein product [Polarella glacialis]|uniref:Uncharacterized protein n=1 Tax=Polarella glacialis TaxID=89957 RepID=A0A813J3W0_POLGL|nr:unnamed protein product [Polarella glacialis]CAE8663143.1 unnamed protein product [Polarella glacialis]